MRDSEMVLSEVKTGNGLYDKSDTVYLEKFHCLDDGFGLAGTRRLSMGYFRLWMGHRKM